MSITRRTVNSIDDVYELTWLLIAPITIPAKHSQSMGYLKCALPLYQHFVKSIANTTTTLTRNKLNLLMLEISSIGEQKCLFRV